MVCIGSHVYVTGTRHTSVNIGVSANLELVSFVIQVTC